MTRRSPAIKASATCLVVAQASAAALPFAHRIAPLAPVRALAPSVAGGLAAAVLAVHAGSTRLLLAGAGVAFLLLPAGYYAAVLVGGP